MSTKCPPNKILNIKTLTQKIGGRWTSGQTWRGCSKIKTNMQELYFFTVHLTTKENLQQ